MSDPELDGWEPVTRRRSPQRRMRRDVTAGVVLAIVVGFVVWALVAVHPGGPLGADWEPVGGGTVCGPAPLSAPGDLTQGVAAQLPASALTIQSVRLVGARGLTLVEAKVGTVEQVDGTWVAPGTAAGWPNLQHSTMTAATLVPAQGARTVGGPGQVLVLHLRLVDARHAGFDDVAVVYRSGLFRYERRFGLTYRFVPTVECT